MSFLDDIIAAQEGKCGKEEVTSVDDLDFMGFDQKMKVFDTKDEDLYSLLGSIHEIERKPDGDCFLVKQDDELFIIKIFPVIAHNQPHYDVGSEYLFFINKTESFIVAMVPIEDLFLFSEYSEPTAKNAKKIRDFYDLSQKVQESIREQYNPNLLYGSEGHCDEAVRDVLINDIDSMYFKYSLVKMTYHPRVRNTIESLFSEYNNSSLLEKSRIKNKLSHYLTINTTDRNLVNNNFNSSAGIKEMEIRLKESIYGFESVIQRVKDIFYANLRRKNKHIAILFVGGPGTGKTSLVRAISRASGIPLVTIECASILNALDLKGLDSSYDKSSPGVIIEKLYHEGNTQRILLLEEIDKMGKDNRDGNPENALMDIISDDALCYDNYLEGVISLENTIVMATSNSLYGMSDALKNRFEIIHTNDYTIEEKIEIAKKFIIPSYNEEYNLDSSQILVSDDALREIAVSYCDDAGCRDMNTCIRKIYHRVCSQISENEVDVIKISNEDLPEYLGENKCRISLRAKYAVISDLYCDAEKEEISDNFKKLDSPMLQERDRELITRQQSYLINMKPSLPDNREKSIETFLDILDNSHYGMSELKIRIARSLYTQSENRINLLLHGPKGVGKSSIVEAVGKAWNMKVVKISLNGLSDISVIKGSSRTYNGSDAGSIIKGLSKVGTRNAILFLDEMDKIVYNANSDSGIATALIELLDDSGTWNDHFLGFPIDLKNVIIIATANDIFDINPILLNRFRAIEVPGYSRSEKFQIAKEYLMPSLLESKDCHGVNVNISDKALLHIINNYISEPGVRTLNANLETLVEKGIVDSMKKKKKKYNIDTNTVSEVLGNPISSGDFFPSKEKQEIGIAKGLAVNSQSKSGSMFGIEVSFRKTTGLLVTGNARQVVEESAKIALTLVENITNIHYDGIHIHMGEGSVPKDGSSAGVAIFVSIMSMYLNFPIPTDIAFTGEITLKGYVTEVGGIKEKIQAAAEGRCKTVFIPEDNYNKLDNAYIQKNNIKIIMINNVSQLISELFPKSRRYKM